MNARRGFLEKLLGLCSLPLFAGVARAAAVDAPAEPGTIEPIRLSPEEWREKLTDKQYHILREEGTEYAGTSPLNGEKRDGTYHCAGCGLLLFHSKWKYESGTGWPSFWDVVKDHIGTKVDKKLWMERTEYHCARCGGHQGHVFEDGPEPTGLRYCNNGVALEFRPTGSA
ncbi:MAG: peptide-methionine (R)-S-oxide reductase MsrB [Halofilum sp. (in: g-proteobacteria)]|nr:peptide-methionine (R)-S-oxide reductase MsrB [Halofilum sp. (in: g-proteobacteria)]